MFERAHESQLMFCALCMVSPVSAVSWNHQGCNRQSMQRVQNFWSIGSALLFKCSDANVVFQTAIFLILVVRNNKRFSGIDGKTAATAFPEICNITVILSSDAQPGGRIWGICPPPEIWKHCIAILNLQKLSKNKGENLYSNHF